MSVASTSFSLDEDGRLRINQAAPKVTHAAKSIGATQVILETGLTNRRKLYIKPLQSGTDPTRPRRWIVIGPSGFDTAEGSPVWEEFELVLDVGPDDDIFAKKGDSEMGDVKVRLLEIGED